MKVIVLENNYYHADEGGDLSWYIVADSAISNAGKPFYMPDEYGEVTVSVSLAFRFCRLGKSIAPKFAPRYYKEVASAVHFRLRDLKEEMQNKGVSFSPAVSFDRSVMAGDYVAFDSLEQDVSLTLKINGEPVGTWNLKDMCQNINEIICKFSRLNTIKMGDVMLPALGPQFRIKEGDFIEVSGEGLNPLTIKVK